MEEQGHLAERRKPVPEQVASLQVRELKAIAIRTSAGRESSRNFVGKMTNGRRMPTTSGLSTASEVDSRGGRDNRSAVAASTAQLVRPGASIGRAGSDAEGGEAPAESRLRRSVALP